ncbi:MAG: hypothetical protein HOK21_09810 [Rhodospirillaceae bacterium]|jgi:hypothetical protein|nr:hypothetical protein [Rhodospirillaceae bacterium]MBT4691425.1 hypothetical protein [Rhodospirillaceae bacterium]MBT5082928.1 hypothetical protein [Rhodospirillaceae bacterium]MBT5524372.1 hypothetical protein [Rhodospirillaceae bacterium]MBT5878832.1 hypothetical protein [Rhodospirillaceae bacterium]
MAQDLMNPCGIFANEDAPLAVRGKMIGGDDKVVIGLFSNQKANADLFMDNLENLLGARFDNVEFLRGYKAASVPANFSDEFLDRCDFVAAGFGD